MVHYIFTIVLIVVLTIFAYKWLNDDTTKDIDTPSVMERADVEPTGDPLWMIKDANVRAAANRDVDRLLAKYSELPKTDAFRRDVGLSAVYMPKFFGKNSADLDAAALPILQSINDDHQKYPKDPQRDLQRYIAAMDWAESMGLDTTCKDTPTGKECESGTIVDRTLAWSALTILWRHGLEWKKDYGVALTSLLLRGSFWPEVYKSKTQKHILLRFGKCFVTTDIGCADPDSCVQYVCDTEKDAEDIIRDPGLVCKQGKVLECERKSKTSLCNCVSKVERADDNCRKPCPQNLAPVCGYDTSSGTSRNYSNKCVFSIEQCRNPNLEFVKNGRCPIDS